MFRRQSPTILFLFASTRKTLWYKVKYPNLGYLREEWIGGFAMEQGQNQDRGIRVIDGFRFTIGVWLAGLLISAIPILLFVLFLIGTGFSGVTG